MKILLTHAWKIHGGKVRLPARHVAIIIGAIMSESRASAWARTDLMLARFEETISFTPLQNDGPED